MQQSGAPGLRMMTYNMHKGFGVGNFRFILHELRREIEHLHCDVVCLQEVLGEHRKHGSKRQNWPEMGQFEFLADQIWPHHVYGKNAVYEQGHHGNAILSRYAFNAWENLNVSPYESASRSILHGVLHVPGMTADLHIICIHFGLLGSERHGQVSALIERIRAHVPDTDPLIVAGDFNDWRGAAGKRIEHALNMTEVFRTLTGKHARSFPAWAPTLSVDRIYVRGMRPTGCERIDHAPWRGLSDHLPLTCTLLPETA